MTTELLITEKSTGKIYEASKLAESITYTTNRTGSPGELKFSLANLGGMEFQNGDVVRLTIDGVLIFYGWIFKISVNRWKEADVTCYDRLRYLKANASYAFYGQTAGQIIEQIAADFELSIGVIEDTGYALPSFVMEDKTCLDIISEAINDLRVARKAAKNDPDPLSSARGFHDVVIPIMDRLRMAADHAEQVCGEDFWPLPTYTQMLWYVKD